MKNKHASQPLIRPYLICFYIFSCSRIGSGKKNNLRFINFDCAPRSVSCGRNMEILDFHASKHSSQKCKQNSSSLALAGFTRFIDCCKDLNLNCWFLALWEILTCLCLPIAMNENRSNTFEHKIKWIANVWLRSYWNLKLNCSTLPYQNPHLSCNKYVQPKACRCHVHGAT